ncbi:hypothetical protein O181_056243 [Austropuccinia psidii MF-1]|uniref:Integrase catalytic domain-containing protein n=1 Tax=Austropuccinia psidii MF-1 TaxID=1389203 RepID=A0A9Q3E986_9BASI|nr:hypothetical protein [Austropuccinia psidii MF-1]
MHQRLNPNFNPSFDNISEAIQSAEATSGIVVPIAVVDNSTSISAVAYTTPTRAASFRVSNIIGPFDKYPEGNWFLLSLRDHASTYTFTTALKSRSEVPEKIIFWVKFLFNLLPKYPAQLCSDNGGEYSGKLARKLCAFGIEWIPTKPYCPDQNGEAKRVNRTIGGMASTMLHSSKLPETLWSFAYSCAMHVHN